MAAPSPQGRADLPHIVVCSEDRDSVPCVELNLQDDLRVCVLGRSAHRGPVSSGGEGLPVALAQKSIDEASFPFGRKREEDKFVRRLLLLLLSEREIEPSCLSRV